MAIISVELNIKGIECGGCGTSVTFLSKQIPGVYGVRVDYKRKTGVWEFDDSQTNLAHIIKTLAQYGYTGEVA